MSYQAWGGDFHVIQTGRASMFKCILLRREIAILLARRLRFQYPFSSLPSYLPTNSLPLGGVSMLRILTTFALFGLLASVAHAQRDEKLLPKDFSIEKAVDLYMAGKLRAE